MFGFTKLSALQFEVSVRPTRAGGERGRVDREIRRGPLSYASLPRGPSLEVHAPRGAWGGARRFRVMIMVVLL